MLNIRTITCFINALKQDSEQQRSKKYVLVLTRARQLEPYVQIKHQIAYPVWQLYAAPNVGTRLNVYRLYGNVNAIQYENGVYQNTETWQTGALFCELVTTLFKSEALLSSP